MSNVRYEDPISKIYYISDDDQITPNYFANLQRMGGCACYINYHQILDYHFKYFDKKIFILEYDIPPDQQEKILKLYNETKGIANNNPYSFSATYDIRPKELLNFDHYKGYWEFSRNKVTGNIISEFHACDDFFKQTTYQLIKNTDHLSISKKNLEQLDNALRNHIHSIGLSSLLIISAFAFDNPIISASLLLGGTVYLSYELYQLNQKLNEKEKTINFIRHERAQHSLFAKQPKINLNLVVENKSLKIAK